MYLLNDGKIFLHRYKQMLTICIEGSGFQSSKLIATFKALTCKADKTNKDKFIKDS